MKMKAIFASLAACTLAATAMAMAVSADAKPATGLDDYQVTDDYGTFFDIAKMTDDVAAVKSVDVYVKDSVWNGCIEVSCNSDSWGWDQIDTAKDNGDGTFTATATTSFDAATDDLIKLTVQDWDPDGQLAEVVAVVLKDADGNALKTIGTVPGATTDATTAASTTTTTTTTTTKATTKAGATSTTKAGDTKTGDAGVGVAVAALSLAGVAAFVARKKD